LAGHHVGRAHVGTSTWKSSTTMTNPSQILRARPRLPGLESSHLTRNRRVRNLMPATCRLQDSALKELPGSDRFLSSTDAGHAIPKLVLYYPLE
jgi:hypothetical protein